MATIKRSPRRARARRDSKRKESPVLAAKQFLRNTFYYLKSEQMVKISRRLLCETA